MCSDGRCRSSAVPSISARSRFPTTRWWTGWSRRWRCLPEHLLSQAQEEVQPLGRAGPIGKKTHSETGCRGRAEQVDCRSARYQRAHRGSAPGASSTRCRSSRRSSSANLLRNAWSASCGMKKAPLCGAFCWLVPVLLRSARSPNGNFHAAVARTAFVGGIGRHGLVRRSPCSCT